MKKYLKWTAIALALVLVGIQFVRPARTNPPFNEAETVQAKLNVPPEISDILARSCKDCHSNQTNWIWYSNVAPISWLVARHVAEGRREVNFSEWGKMSAGRAARKLGEICEQVETGEMPLWNYVLMHPSARLTDADKKTLCDWAKNEQAKIDAELQTQK